MNVVGRLDRTHPSPVRGRDIQSPPHSLLQDGYTTRPEPPVSSSWRSFCDTLLVQGASLPTTDLISMLTHASRSPRRDAIESIPDWDDPTRSFDDDEGTASEQADERQAQYLLLHLLRPHRASLSASEAAQAVCAFARLQWQIPPTMSHPLLTAAASDMATLDAATLGDLACAAIKLGVKPSSTWWDELCGTLCGLKLTALPPKR